MRLRTRSLALVVLFGILLPGPGDAQQPDGDPLERALRMPAATGLLVTRVEDGTPAARIGLRPGDIIVSYAGAETPDIPAMNLAKERGEEADSIALEVVRGGWKKRFEIATGRIGVSLVPVVEGTPRSALPERTVLTLDYAPLLLGPRDDWYGIHREGAKCGWGRIRTRVMEGVLFVLTDEIIDTGTDISHNSVTSAVDLDAVPTARMTVFRDWVNDWVRYGLRGVTDPRGTHWNSVSSSPDLGESPVTFHLPEWAMPVYMAETIASLLPQREGACCHFRPLFEGNGQCGLLSALVGRGMKPFPGAEEGSQAFRVDWMELDGTTTTSFWVGGNHSVLYADYGGGITARRDTEEGALSDLPATVRARMSR